MLLLLLAGCNSNNIVIESPLPSVTPYEQQEQQIEEPQETEKPPESTVSPVAPGATPVKIPTPTSSPSPDPKEEQFVTLLISAGVDGRMILPPTQVEFENGDTAFSVLKRITRSKKIQMSYTGASSNPYVEGIDNLYEFDKGPESGWLCFVNGVFINKSSGSCSISPGDEIKWQYTVKLGDLGIEF